MLGGERGEAQRPLEVDRDRLVEEVGGHVEQRRRHRRDPRVVDQHVDAPELGDGRVDQRLALVPVADVAADRQRPPPERAHLVGDDLTGFELPARDHDVGARLREPERHRAPEAFAPAGDDHDLPGRVEARDGHGTITSLPTTPRSAMRWSACGSSAKGTSAVTALRKPPVAHERGEPRVDVVELGAGVPAREHADERRVRDHQVVGRDLRPATAGEADRQQSPVARQRAGGIFGERPTDGVVEQIDASARGELAERGRERAVAVVDRRLGTELAAERGALVVADDRDHPGAERAARAGPRRSRSRRPRRARPASRLRRGVPVDETDPPGEVRDPEPGRLGIGETVGHGERTGGRGQALLGERAVAPDERGHAHDPVADREPDALPHRGDRAGGLLPRGEGQRRRQRVGPPAHEHVGQTETRRGHPDPHLTGPGLGRLALDQVQHLGRLARALHLPRAHQQPAWEHRGDLMESHRNHGEITAQAARSAVSGRA